MMSEIVFIIVLVFVSNVNCNPCSDVNSVDISDALEFANGSILFNGLEFPNGTWYEKEMDGMILRFGCPCINRKCLRKCCDDGSAFHGSSCNVTEDDSLYPFSLPLFRGSEPVDLKSDGHFFFLYGVPCDDRYLLDSSMEGTQMYIQENGTLFEIANNRPQWHEPSMYCVDMMMRETPVLVAAVCFPDDDNGIGEGENPALLIAYSVGLLFSVPFLLATFLVYAFIPDLRNLHGLCLMAYCAGLIVAYVFLAYLKLSSGEVGVAMTGCLVIAFIVYFAFQTSFFWLNVMCFDIWRTFRGYSGGGRSKKRDRRRFAMYGGYAWGVPLVLTIITIVMQLHGSSSMILPGIGARRCWFENWHSELIYFYTPVLILVVCNTVLFAVTAHRIRSIRQETAILKSSESARSDLIQKDKQRYGLYLKLFVVMGVNWSVELISFAVGGNHWYWIITDLSNLALGIFIFFIFVWKNKVRNLLLKRIRGRRGIKSSTETSGTGRWATRSSSAPYTEDTRVSADESAVRLREIQ